MDMKTDLALGAQAQAEIILPPSDIQVVHRAPRFTLDWACYDQNGKLVWEDHTPNLVVDVGCTYALETLFRTGVGSPAWYLGLVSAASFSAYAAADTMASHAGWLESTAYTQSNRVAITFGSAAAAKSLAASAASVFSINASATLKGAFIVNQNTKGGTTGTLYSAVNFTQGDRPVDNGYTVNVTPTVTAA
jgi:hypothetical protein